METINPPPKIAYFWITGTPLGLFVPDQYFRKILLLALRASFMRYYWSPETKLSINHFATPDADNYDFSQLLPFMVYFTEVAVAPPTINRLEWA